MPSLASIIAYLFLFLGLCVFVVLALALWNIFKKSYNRRNSIIVVSLIALSFSIFAVLAMTSANRTISILNNTAASPSLSPEKSPNNSNSDSLY